MTGISFNLRIYSMVRFVNNLQTFNHDRNWLTPRWVVRGQLFTPAKSINGTWNLTNMGWRYWLRHFAWSRRRSL